MIAALWQVNNISTSQLMQQFYSALSTGNPNITILQALRTAQQRMIDGEMAAEKACEIADCSTLHSYRFAP